VFYDKLIRRALKHIQHPFFHVNHLRVFVVAYVRQRHQWGFNSLIGETDKKERTNHCHHAIDAVVIASVI
jgi:CRISPR/Cas system Type II protein with McrA/HNH and RuvC-like nuclease domain